MTHSIMKGHDHDEKETHLSSCRISSAFCSCSLLSLPNGTAIPVLFTCPLSIDTLDCKEIVTAPETERPGVSWIHASLSQWNPIQNPTYQFLDDFLQVGVQLGRNLGLKVELDVRQRVRLPVLGLDQPVLLRLNLKTEMYRCSSCQKVILNFSSTFAAVERSTKHDLQHSPRTS